MPKFLQGCQNKNTAYVSGNLTKAFTSNVTAGNLIAVAVYWFAAASAATGPAVFTVSDNQNGTHKFAAQQLEPSPGFYASLGVFYIPAAASGATTITVSANQPGALFFAAHEVQPDSGTVFVYNGAGNGRTNPGDEGALAVSAIGQDSQYQNTLGEYDFLCWGIANKALLADIPSPSFINRQFVPNNTQIGETSSTFEWFGTLATWDINNPSVHSFTIFGGPNTVTSDAVCAYFAQIVPAVDIPTASPVRGTYIGTHSVTLSQDQGKPMYYTTDGSTPTTSSTLYSGPISVTESLTIKVLAHDTSGILADTLAYFTYNIIVPPPAGATITITWVRRTRLGGSWLDGNGTVPVNEDGEVYNLYIMDADGVNIVRAVKGLTSPSFVYTADMQQADWGELQKSYYVKVAQVSATVGEGFFAINPQLGLV